MSLNDWNEMSAKRNDQDEVDGTKQENCKGKVTHTEIIKIKQEDECGREMLTTDEE